MSLTHVGPRTLKDINILKFIEDPKCFCVGGPLEIKTKKISISSLNNLFKKNSEPLIYKHI